MERQLWRGEDGGSEDPFGNRSGVRARSCSARLQRAIVSFGLDFPYGQCCEQLLEHYGLEISKSAARATVNAHSSRIGSRPEARVGGLPARGAEAVVVEADGSMLAVVEPAAPGEVADRRKGKRVEWREYKLCAARAKGSAETFYDGCFGPPESIGAKWGRCAAKAGWGSGSRIHGVADGAEWIRRQFDSEFGSRGALLLDFFHLCERLAEAGRAAGCDEAWLGAQKQRLKRGEAAGVAAELESLAGRAGDREPIDAALRYMANRPGQLAYDEAIAADLPIGSGMIESGHRHILQRRLKVPGAWRLQNAENIARARIVRANHGLDSYWQHREDAKAA